MRKCLFPFLFFLCASAFAASPPYHVNDPSIQGNFEELEGKASTHLHDGNGSPYLKTILPSTGSLYDLGSPTRPWRNLYVGNVSSGVFTGIWGISSGGTNSGTALSGSSIMISNGSAIVQGQAGTTTTLLHGNAGGAPTYSAVSLANDVTGTLSGSNVSGGTFGAVNGSNLTNLTTTNLSGPYHLGVYTVAAGAASAADKARADYVGDGVDDENAIISAINAATSGANNRNGAVKVLSGHYIFTNHPLEFPDLPNRNSNLIFDARGAEFETVTTDTDTILIHDIENSEIYLGYVHSTSSHSLVHVVPKVGGGGFYNNVVTWDDLSNQNPGAPTALSTCFLIDNSAGVGNSTNYFYGLNVSGCHQGIVELGGGDTNVWNVNWISDCDFDVDVGSNAVTTMNAETWNVNVDACVLTRSGTTAIRTGASWETWNGPICAIAADGTKNLVLTSGASYNTFNFKPNLHQDFAGTVTDNSGNTTNGFGVMTTISTPTAGSFGLWDASHFEQIDGSNLNQDGSGNVSVNGANAAYNFYVNGNAGFNNGIAAGITSGNSYILGSVGISTNAPNANLDVKGNYQWGNGVHKSTGNSDGSLTLWTPLLVGSGGSGATTFTSHGVLLGEGTSAFNALPAMANGGIIIGAGTGVDPDTGTIASGTGITVTNGAGTISIAQNFLGVTTQTFTSGSGTYTKPAGVTWETVTMCGGGGGGQGGGTGSPGDGVSGSSSTFGSSFLVANGGGNGGTSGSSGTGGTASGGDINVTGGFGMIGILGSATQSVGGMGGVSLLGSGSFGRGVNAAGASGTGYGSGGGGGGDSLTGNAGFGGGAGGCLKKTISNPSSTYSYVVGPGGSGGGAGTSGQAGATGQPGIILVEEHYN